MLDPTGDVYKQHGLVEFRRRVLAWAEHSVAMRPKMSAQGMITWDVEGEQFPHSITFIGDPSMSSKMASEVASIMDEYFFRFRKAGLSELIRKISLRKENGAQRSSISIQVAM